MKPFMRSANVWRLLGIGLLVLSVFVSAGTLETSWAKVSVLGAAGLGLIFAPMILEGITRWKGKP